ncbi:MAG: hypothetical protein JXA52_10455 [Planctomycetes bacterium]|nr:hypothetical protein [Planctomycetota bacterium]
MDIPAIPIIIIGDSHEENRQRYQRRRRETGRKAPAGGTAENPVASLPQQAEETADEEHIDVVA